MKPKDPTAPKHAHYHEHDPLPPGLLPEDTAVASAQPLTATRPWEASIPTAIRSP